MAARGAGGVVDGVISAGTSFYSNAQAYERGDISAADATADVVVDTGVGVASGLTGAAAGAAIGSVVPVVGTAVGAVIGFGVGMLASWGASTALEETDSVLHIRWEPTPGVVQFIQPLPMTVPIERKADVGRALHRINLKLAMLGFTLDEETGHVAFRAQAMMADMQGLLPGMIGLMIRTSIETAATHWPGLRAIAES